MTESVIIIAILCYTFYITKAAPTNRYTRIRDAHELYEKGILTKTEFEKEKSRLLSAWN